LKPRGFNNGALLPEPSGQNGLRPSKIKLLMSLLLFLEPAMSWSYTYSIDTTDQKFSMTVPELVMWATSHDMDQTKQATPIIILCVLLLLGLVCSYRQLLFDSYFELVE
jgi:hypothetical protein